MVALSVVFVILSLLVAAPCSAFGVRPYELDWAERLEDDHPPLVDFEDLSGWRVVTKNAHATFNRSAEQRIWGDYVGKLTYRATGAGPEVRVWPPEPIPIDHEFDAVTMWSTAIPSHPRIPPRLPFPSRWSLKTPSAGRWPWI